MRESEQDVSNYPPPSGSEQGGAPLPPPGGYMPPYPSPYPPPLTQLAQQPRAGGAAAAFKWGAIFGAVAGLINLVQVVVGAAAVNANLSGIDGFSQQFQAYQQCIQSSGSSTSCATPVANDAFTSIIASFYGSCCAIFLLTLVLYFLAARFAARQAERRGPGIWAAIIAAAFGSVLYFIFGIVAVATTGHSGLIGGITGATPQGESGAWTIALVIYTIIADAIGLLVAAGAAALLGLGGAALGLRGVTPTTPTMPPGMPLPSPLPPPAHYGPPPIYSSYAQPGMPGSMPGSMPGAMPPPQAPPAPDYSLPAQYPPLPSHYESPHESPPGNQGTTENTGNP